MNKLTCFIFLALFTGCIGGQSVNSHTYDANLAEEGGCLDTTNEKLCDSIEIIISKCIDCHTNTHNDWIKYDTNEKWIASGKVVKGKPDQSSLITWLANTGGSMPKDKPEISYEDYQTLRSWITDM